MICPLCGSQLVRIARTYFCDGPDECEFSTSGGLAPITPYEPVSINDRTSQEKKRQEADVIASVKSNPWMGTVFHSRNTKTPQDRVRDICRASPEVVTMDRGGRLRYAISGTPQPSGQEQDAVWSHSTSARG